MRYIRKKLQNKRQATPVCSQ